MSVSTGNAVVKKDKFQDVVGTDEWQVNNLLEDVYEPLSPDVVVKEALESVGVPRTYDRFQGNCKHFAIYMRYGVPVSRQVWCSHHVFSPCWAECDKRFIMLRGGGGNKYLSASFKSNHIQPHNHTLETAPTLDGLKRTSWQILSLAIVGMRPTFPVWDE